MSILVLDVGTTSMRGILYDYKGNKISVCQLPNHVNFMPKGWVSETTEDWSKNTETIIKSICKDEKVNASNIKAVAITSQRSSIIPVDKTGSPLMDTIMWQDVRNKSICEELAPYNEKLFEKTGSRVNSVFSGSKMTWVRRNKPEIYEKVFKFVNIPEYINFLMTGEYNSDYTYASRSGLFNIRTKTWDPELLELYEMDPEKLCHLAEPGEVCGYITGSYADKTGLPAGIPVIHAGGDQQCAAIGQGVTESGNVSIVAGTGGFIIAALDQVPENLTDNVICNCSSIAGNYVIEANVLACSAAFDWFVHEIYGMEKIDYSFTEQELLKEKAPTDCLVLPYFKGRGAPDWNSGAKAVFANVTLATRRSEMFKSMMESIFMELSNHIEAFSDYVAIREINISGGMTSSKAMCQLIADVLGRKVFRQEDTEATARGAYLATMKSLGYYKSIGEAAKALNGGERTVYEPDERLHEGYAKKQREMNWLYKMIRA